MPIINASDTGSGTDSGSKSSSNPTKISSTEGAGGRDSQIVAIQTGLASSAPPSLATRLPGLIPGLFNKFVNVIPASFYRNFSGHIPGSIPGLFNDINPALLAANAVSNAGWAVAVISGQTQTMLAPLPRFTSLSFSKELSGEGSGQIVIDRNDAVFNTMTMVQGSGTDIIDYENIFRIYYNGNPVFEFLGETIDEMQVDAGSEQQPVTISGPGTARVLQWAKVQPPGFPNVVYKLASLVDSVSTNVINTLIWNLTATTDISNGNIYVTSGGGSISIQGQPNNFQAPTLASGFYDASNSSFSAKVTPLGMAVNPSNLVANGSFVLGLQNWDTNASALQNGGAVATPYNSDSQDGDGYSAFVACGGASTNQGIEQTVPNLQPNTFYWINAWVKLTSGPSAVLQVRDITNGISALSYGGSTVLNSWQQLSVGITTGSNSNVSLLISINSGGTQFTATDFIVDNVSLIQMIQFPVTAISLTSSTNANNQVIMELTAGQMFRGRLFTNGVESDVYFNSQYDAVGHQYWRIREFAGIFYFDGSPDGTNWTGLGSIAHSWSVTNLSVGMYCFWPSSMNYPMGTLPAIFGSFNSATNIGLQNAYTSVPNVGGIFLDLLQQAQRRGTISFVTPTFTAFADSAGKSWTDSASMTIQSGGDLETQLSASVSAVDGDWIMNPGFQLAVGLPGSLGVDRSKTVIFYQSGQIVTSEKLRVRDQIANYVVASDGTGNLVLETDNSSQTRWNQREEYVESSSPTSKGTLQQLANAALLQFKNQQVQRTLAIPPDLPSRTIFKDFDVGDWIGIQDSDLVNNYSARVIVAAVSIDATENVTIELTLETRIQLLIEMMNNLLQKIGSTADAQVVPSPGAASQVVTASSKSVSRTSYAQTVGDGTTTVFHIAHALGTNNIHVAIWATASPFGLLAPTSYSVTADNLNQATVTFTSAPTINQYRVVFSI